MSGARIGDIKMFAGNFAPRNWALCNGQTFPISDYQELFSILGFTYGGNGVTTFALPDLRGRVPMHAGIGAGLSSRQLGEKGGVENVTLLSTQMPQHIHNTLVSNGPANQGSPVGSTPAVVDGANAYASGGTATGGATSIAGGNQPHSNVQPFLAVNFIICVFGVFPSRN
jgi:microcystin-dependent protein